MTNPRRDFLGWLGASALLGATASPLSASESDAMHSPPAINNKFDMSWTDRLTGKYKAVFDSPELSEGAALYRAIFWMSQHKDVYGTDRKEMSPVIVFRHAGIPLVMDDSYWAEFEAGKAAKMRGAKGKKWAMANPIRAAAPEAPEDARKYTLESFIADGGIVLACNLAFGGIVYEYSQKRKLKQDEARKAALEHLIPGIILQPSGVFAALRAQQGGCGYLIAS